MKTPITFFVEGIPKPAGSKRAFAIKKGGVYTGKTIVIDANPNSKDWKADVRHAARDNFKGEPWDCALAVTFTFMMPRPQSHFRSGKNKHLLKDDAPSRPITRPDVLKCARGIEDALTGLVYMDDNLIVDEHLHKVYGTQPGCLIEIKAIE